MLVRADRDRFWSKLLDQIRANAKQIGKLPGLITIGGRGPAELAGRLIDYQCDRFGQTDATIGDAGAVCAVIDRLGLTTMRLPVRVELAGTYSRGRTIVDRRDWSGDLAHDPHGMASTSVQVAMSVDADRFAALWLKSMKGGAR